MPRDYKHAANRNRPKASGGWVWFISGMGAGLLAALVFYLQTSRPLVETTPTSPVIAPMATSAAAPTSEPAPAQPEPEPAEPPTPKPRFDFYTILPEMEVKVPEWASPERGSADSPALEPGSYVLQVASFQRYEDADKVKARLALNGIVADIQRVVINGKDTWYRVRVGPFKDLGKVDAMRLKLQEAGMDFMLLRIKEG